MACEIVAELSNAHNGSLERMLRLIDAAKDAGADSCKAQCFTPDELVALRGNGPAPQPWGGMGYSMRALYEKAQTPLEWFPKIAAHCERIGMPWFSSVFGAESLACLEAVGCPRYKISHFEHQNRALVDSVAATLKPIIISVPYATEAAGYVYCPAGYPAEDHEMHLNHRIWGLSSHNLHRLTAPLAVALGAQYLEYHFELRDEPSELEHAVSVNDWDFIEVVQSVRQAELLIG